jgi:hypothetical protein
LLLQRPGSKSALQTPTPLSWRAQWWSSCSWHRRVSAWCVYIGMFRWCVYIGVYI